MREGNTASEKGAYHTGRGVREQYGNLTAGNTAPGVPATHWMFI